MESQGGTRRRAAGRDGAAVHPGRREEIASDFEGDQGDRETETGGTAAGDDPGDSFGDRRRSGPTRRVPR